MKNKVIEVLRGTVYSWKYTKIKMINVVTDKKICYNIYTMCKKKREKNWK